MLKVKMLVLVFVLALLVTACGDYPPEHPCSDPAAFSFGACP
jgi:hypothetical protein